MTAQRLPTSKAFFQYVLVPEWLNEGDKRTGLELVNYLKTLGMPSVLRECRSAEDVRAAVEAARLEIATRGVPVIHIESHGDDPKDAIGTELAFGTDIGPGLSWREFGEILSPLNTDSDFRLLVFGAACFGLGLIAAMGIGENPAPFSVAVGFSTSVGESSLLGATKEFYKSLHSRVPMNESVENAGRELRGSAEKISVTSSAVVAMQVLRGVYEGIRNKDALTERAKKLIAKVRNDAALIDDALVGPVSQHLVSRSRTISQERWDSWFPTEVQRRDALYRLDWSLIEMTDEQLR